MSQGKKQSRDTSRSRCSRDSHSSIDIPQAFSSTSQTNFYVSNPPSTSTSSSGVSTDSTTAPLHPPHIQPCTTLQYHQTYHIQQYQPASSIPSHYNPFNNMSGPNTSAIHSGFLSGSSSPMTGNKIVKTWRQMGDKTKSKTRDILKRWQTMNNGQTSEDSTVGVDDLSDVSGSTESGGGSGAGMSKVKKNSWSVHVWSKYSIILKRLFYVF